MDMDDDETPARLKAKPTWLISQVAAHAHGLLTERLAAAGARGYHYRLLAALAEFGPSSQASLGRRTRMDRSDVVAAVSELAAQGLVERAADPADRRRNVVTLTPRGTARLERLDHVLAGVQDELLAPLSGAERAELARLLTRLLDSPAS
jgi:DNA-binding MarR family transcriptional regulator